MSKKKKNVSKSNHLVISSLELFDYQKPLYNGYACGTGLHKDKSKYSRKEKHRHDWREQN